MKLIYNVGYLRLDRIENHHYVEFVINRKVTIMELLNKLRITETHLINISNWCSELRPEQATLECVIDVAQNPWAVSIINYWHNIL